MQTNNLIVFETISLLGPKTLNLILKANICKYEKCGKLSSEFVKYENTLLLGWVGEPKDRTWRPEQMGRRPGDADDETYSVSERGGGGQA